MADLVREGNSIILKLTKIEEVEGLHKSITVPVSSVQSVEILNDVISAVHGMRLPGTGVPGVVAIGTFISKDEKTFAVVHHDTLRGLEIQLSNNEYTKLIVGLHNPEEVKQSLKIK